MSEPDFNDLAGQVAIVTGGASGIGLGIAQALDRRGCQVVVASRDEARIAAALGTMRQATGFPGCDVRDPTRVEALMDFTVGRFGRIDIVVASAGIGRSASYDRATPSPVLSLDEHEWDAVIDVNLKGIFLVCRAALKHMMARKSGQLINISSARGALRGQAFGSAYCASKMAVRAMFQSLAAEVMPFGIRAMSILPDAVDTTLIAGTGLAKRGAMTPATVGDFVADVLSLPLDVTLEDTLVAPLGGRRERKQAAG